MVTIRGCKSDQKDHSSTGLPPSPISHQAPFPKHKAPEFIFEKIPEKHLMVRLQGRSRNHFVKHFCQSKDIISIIMHHEVFCFAKLDKNILKCSCYRQI